MQHASKQITQMAQRNTEIFNSLESSIKKQMDQHNSEDEQRQKSLTAGMEGFIGGLVVGIFLHVSSTILFELQKDHRLPTGLWLIVIIGLLSGFGLSQFIH